MELLFGLGSLIWTIVVIWAIIKIVRSSAGGLAKVLWVLVLVFFPVLGFLIWLVAGPKG